MIGAIHHLVATDDCQWLSVSNSELSECVTAENNPPAGSNHVVALSYDCSNKNVVGMLLGEDATAIMKGVMSSYKAHIMKPQEQRDERLREQNQQLRYAVQSFAIGDVVQQLKQTPGAATAVVVRVLYTRRAVQQSRRMLILLELPSKGPGYALPEEKIFFPGSWSNWTRIPGEDYVTLSKASIRELNKVPSACKARTS